jgi:hypothetical protein
MATQSFVMFAIGWVIILFYDLTMVVIGLINPQNNTHIYNIAFPLQQLFIMYFFVRLLQLQKLLVVLFLFGLFALWNLFLIQGRVALNTYSLALGGVVILLFAFYKLYRLYKIDSRESLYRDPAFWICAGFIIYWGMGGPFFALYNFLWQTTPGFFIVYFYTINFGFTVLLNLSIIKALQCNLKAQR